MIKIGFIDYYLDNWHADNYPSFFRENSNGECIVAWAYGQIDNPNGISNEEWSGKHNIPLCKTFDELIEKSDCIAVLSPDDLQMHVALSDKALKSGKRVYIDKILAAEKSDARQMLDTADLYGGLCWSSSALGFAAELREIDRESTDVFYIEGPESFEVGAVHLIEQAVMLADANPVRVMATGGEKHPSFVVEFDNGKAAHLIHRNDDLYTYAVTPVDKNNNCVRRVIESQFFAEFIKAVISFFKTGEIPVSRERIMRTVSVMQSAEVSLEKPFEWVNID